jgi:polysaccharide biosynthesis/export protein
MRMIKKKSFPLPALFWAIALCVLDHHATTLAAEPNDYRVGPGDLLKIAVVNAPELATDARVSESGNITFPFIGAVQVAGLTTRAAEELIANRLVSGSFVRQPQVSVLVAEFQSQQISVLGQVTKPGQFSLTRSARVLDMLAEAGGLDHATAADDATLLRSNGEKEHIDLLALFDGDPVQNFRVTAGDTIFIPKAAQFYVYGQVQKPGAYRLERSMTVSRAISVGGGLTPRGSEHHMVVKRRNAKGEEKKESVKGSDFLKADDVLLVNEGWF